MEDKLATLTNREREVLGLIGQGLSLAEISEKLFRSLKTIQTHRLSLGRKLEASNRVELARIAIQHGLAPLDAPGTPTDARDEDARQQRAEIADNSKAWQTLQAIESQLPSVGGPAWFRRLVELISEHLGFSSVGISELSADGRSLVTFAFLSNRTWLDEMTYPIEDSVCQSTLREATFFVRKDVQMRFPNDHPLAELGAQTYLGARMLRASGQPLGVMWAVHDQPVDVSVEPEKIIRLLADHAAVKLEHWRAVDELHELREQLEDRVAQRTAELQRSIEELQAAQARERAQEQRFTELVETMTDGLATLNLEGLISYANPRFAAILGRSPDQLIGRPITSFMPPESVELYHRHREKDLHSREPRQRYVCTYLRPDGAIVRGLVSPRSLFDQEGRLVGAFAVLTELPLPAIENL